MKITLLAFAITLIAVPTVVHADFDWTEVDIPVRDGNVLAADVYTTDSTAQKPVILIQTPYNRKLYRLTTQLPPQAGGSFPLDTLKYNYVIVDWRGFFGSSGAAEPGYDRGLDGYDVVEWIADQSWSNGKVGTWGPSALGAIQYQTARHKPPHLVCAVPLVKSIKTEYRDYYYGGEYRKAHVEALQRLGFVTTNLILNHPTNDLFVRTVENSTDVSDEIAVPMLMVGGWYDHFPDQVLEAFEDLRLNSDTSVRHHHKLIVGPWTHSGVDDPVQGQLRYDNAVDVSEQAALQFFGYWLLGEETAWPASPTVRYYQMGENEWRSAEGWRSVVESSDTVQFYLRGEQILSRIGIGGPDFPPDEFRFDPADPSPTHGGSFFDPLNNQAAVGPYDQAEIVESRNDNIVYTSPPLEEDIDIAGPVTIRLYAASDREDTDYAVRLCDVYPDNRSMLITQGIRRLRFRNGFTPQDTALGVPDEVYEVNVQLRNLAYTYKAGHRVRIIVTGSNHPHFEVNPNTAAPLYDSDDSVVASNRIYLAPSHQSAVILPVRSTSSIRDEREQLRSFGSSAWYDPVARVARCSVESDRSVSASIGLFDLLGRPVEQASEHRLHSGTNQLALELQSDLRSGSYFIRIVTDERITVLKFVAP